jgi:serine O-acetyltransferase
VYRYSGRSDRRAFVSAYLHEPGFRFTYFPRKVALQQEAEDIAIFGYIYNWILLHHYTLRYGFEISPTTLIGR